MTEDQAPGSKILALARDYTAAFSDLAEGHDLSPADAMQALSKATAAWLMSLSRPGGEKLLSAVFTMMLQGDLLICEDIAARIQAEAQAQAQAQAAANSDTLPKIFPSSEIPNA
jgi:hypothetical protein